MAAGHLDHVIAVVEVGTGWVDGQTVSPGRATFRDEGEVTRRVHREDLDAVEVVVIDVFESRPVRRPCRSARNSLPRPLSAAHVDLVDGVEERSAVVPEQVVLDHEVIDAGVAPAGGSADAAVVHRRGLKPRLARVLYHLEDRVLWQEALGGDGGLVGLHQRANVPSTSLVHAMSAVRSPSSASFAVAESTVGENLVAPSVGPWMVTLGATLAGVQAATSAAIASAMEAR